MKYLVQKNDDNLIACRYDGKFDTDLEDNIKYFINFAKCVGCTTLWLSSSPPCHIKPFKNTIELNGLLTVVPGVYIEGSIIPSARLLTPYINDKVIYEHLVPVDAAEGLLVPKILFQYIKPGEAVGTQFDSPACTYQGEIVSTLPADMPVLCANDKLLVTYTRGVIGFYVMDSFDTNVIFDYIKEQHVSHFVSNIELYPELSKFHHVHMEDGLTVFYVLEYMTEVEPGVFKVEDMLRYNDWVGSVVDLVKHEIR